MQPHMDGHTTPAPARPAVAPLILVVDDDQNAREGLAEYLFGAGFRVSQAADGREALDKVKALGPDLVLLDLGLPRLDGWAVIRELRHDESTRATPIVVLTALDYPSAIEPAMADGCDAITTKPCNPATLVAMVRGLLARTYEARARRDS